MTEQRRDLAADLRLCEEAAPGSLHCDMRPGDMDPDWADGGETIWDANGRPVACVLHEWYSLARFIVESSEGWPHAIRRAMEAEAEVEQLRAALSRCGDLADQGYAIGGAVAKENCEQIGMITLQALNGRILGKVGGGGTS